MIQFNSILKDEMSDFLALRKASKSRSTYEHTRHILGNFDGYLCSIGCRDRNLTEDQVAGWIRSLHGKSSSIAKLVVVVRIFLEHLRCYGITPHVPPIPKIHDDYVPYIFSEAELDRILHATDTLEKSSMVRKNTLIHVEQPMVLRLMYGCGLRIGETLSLRMRDVDLDSGVLTLRCTKGDKQRIVPMHHSLSGILKRYCMAMGIVGCPESYLFPTADPLEPLNPGNVKNTFNFILKQCKIPLTARRNHQRGPCLHCLRHVFVFKSFANAQEDGRKIDDTIPYLSIYLGHGSLKETEKYLKFSSDLFPEAMGLFEEFTAQVFPEVDCDG